MICLSETEIKIRIVKSKCMAYMFVWLGFEYEKAENGYVLRGITNLIQHGQMFMN